MEILRGTNLLNDMALEMKDYAIQFYGKEYKKIIDNVYEETRAYEYTSNESFRDVLAEIMGITEEKELEQFEEKYIGDITGFYMKKGDYRWFMKNAYNIILIKNNGDYLQMKENLVHELYGHSVCSINRPSTKIGEIYYFRNGIAYNSSDRKQINWIANEGFIELFATLITRLKYPEFESNKDNYKKAVEVAKTIYEIEGHDKIVELMVKGKGDISKLFDKSVQASWYELSRLLDDTIITSNNNEKIDEMMKEYVKRRGK